MTPAPLRLLDRIVPADLASRMLDVPTSTFAAVPADRLTVLTAFRAARRVVSSDLRKVRAAKRGSLNRARAAADKAPADEAAAIAQVARTPAIVARFTALLADDLAKTADRLASFDLGVTRKVLDIARRLGDST